LPLAGDESQRRNKTEASRSAQLTERIPTLAHGHAEAFLENHLQVDLKTKHDGKVQFLFV